ncbi:class I SAM-dependent DNA methyltransferase [Shewanella xiamenensis]|uniref:site-specific DNA-methyltransferase (adenine-specific) n=1 Tax=Shewanella xiamenensis TaxID=332186 RepID=A0ABT6U6S7_9GAMM|nr:class I SAM-dependent DNA methyltransferase [Shewanella xiamenensis]MDI5830158.1 type I restriction-modification system subunit M [Shewanella xiamenensis]MDL3986575.1 type I restriction-modification system subunit M [Shewanella xiamenensis]
MSISSVIKSIQDIMRKDAGVDGDAQRLGQLSWLLFLKIFDAQEQELEFEQDDYRSPIPSEYLWRNWAEDKEGITGDELLEFVNNELFVDLKNLTAPKDTNPRGYVVKEAFSDAFNYMKNGTLLRQVINKLNEVDFTDSSERHLFGDIYEQILRDLQSAGNAGEFYTPRAVTKFMVNRINPQLGEKVLDPACGTGGFLACAVEHLKAQVSTAAQHQQLQQQIHGVEKKQLPHLLCTTNMLLHGIEVPVQIKHGNTLSQPLSNWDNDVDVIITNPPFGGTEEDGIEKNFPADMQTRETADLFLQLIIEVLKDGTTSNGKGGRAAVVLPDGTLFGEGVKTKIKQLLTSECNLHTIVRLPNGVFAPYTGIKTNILFFTKGAPTKDVWFYEHPYPAGVKSYSKTKPMKFEEFEAEIAWWGDEADGFAARVENEQAWKVSIEDIVARNFNLDIKNPHVGEQISHDPDELLARYATEQAEIQTLRDQLKAILGDALGKGAAKQGEQA